jgi:hypothetical protein
MNENMAFTVSGLIPIAGEKNYVYLIRKTK